MSGKTPPSTEVTLILGGIRTMDDLRRLAGSLPEIPGSAEVRLSGDHGLAEPVGGQVLVRWQQPGWAFPTPQPREAFPTRIE